MQTIPGIGPVLAAVFVAEMGDVSRFDGPEQLACWAGLTPKHHESDTHVRRGRITKQGSRLVRWAAVESVKSLPAHTRVGARRDRVADRRGPNIGAGAAARRQIELDRRRGAARPCWHRDARQRDRSPAPLGARAAR